MIVCFDIGGTTIKGAVATAPEAISPLPRIPTPKDDFGAFIAALRMTLDTVGGTPDCVSISIAGIVDPLDGRATVANIPCLNGRHLRAELQEALGLPVLVANDADCFVMAEAGVGAGRGHDVVFGIILGTGVGGGLVAGGRLINASGGFAGEWGHAPVAATLAGHPPVPLPRFRCGCGLEGCVDATASARGMEKLHQHLHGVSLSSQEIVAAWQAGDGAAARTVDVAVDILASPLALVVNVTGATVVPAGGGLATSLPLLEALDRAVRARILRQTTQPLVVPAMCLIEPGLAGAALLGFARNG